MAWTGGRGSWTPLRGEGLAHLAEDVGNLLRRKKLTLSVAESCTGGKLGDMVTDVPGSSDYFLGGVVSYSNQAKAKLLGVSESMLRSKGAVSEEVAVQMAQGVMKAFNSSIGIGITGIAGPAGGSDSKPVGLVYVALGSAKSIKCEKLMLNGDRSAIKTGAAMRALEMLRDHLERTP